MRLTVAAVVFIAGFAATGYQSTAATPEILIAVREDASPFVSVSNDDQKPSGFLWELCARAVDRAGYTARVHPIDAEDRKAILQSGSTKDGNVRPDLLCDPTTITISRMRNFDDTDGGAPGLEFSPIVFIANGSYVQRKPPQEPAFMKENDKPGPFCDALAAEILATDPPADLTDSVDGDRKWWQPNLFPAEPGEPTENAGAPYAIWGYVEGSTIGDAITDAISQIGDRQIVCKVAFPTHKDAAEAFCKGNIFRYFGDIELIRAAIANSFYEYGTSCQADQSAANEGTYEPYAVVLSSTSHPEFPERFVRALYTMFEDETIDRLFGRYFPGSPKSEYLATLFRINSIPRGNDDAPTPKPPASKGADSQPPAPG